VFHGDFTLTRGGKKATYYVDLHKVSLTFPSCRPTHRAGDARPDRGVSRTSRLLEEGDGGWPRVATAVLHQEGCPRPLPDARHCAGTQGSRPQPPPGRGTRITARWRVIVNKTPRRPGIPARRYRRSKVGAEIAGVAVVVDRDTGCPPIDRAQAISQPSNKTGLGLSK
jgi:orotate phosphoribosyltransferase